VQIQYRLHLVLHYLYKEGRETAEPVCKCRVKLVALVVKLVEYLMHHSHALWVGSFCNFPELIQIVNSRRTDFVGTLLVNRKNVAVLGEGGKEKKRSSSSISVSIQGK
jgi:hypothetical protein